MELHYTVCALTLIAQFHVGNKFTHAIIIFQAKFVQRAALFICFEKYFQVFLDIGSNLLRLCVFAYCEFLKFER